MQPQTESGLVEDFIIPLPSLTAVTSPGIVYVSYTRESPEDYAVGSFSCTLKFVSKELDPSTGEPEEEGYEDEYQLEDVELSAGGDYIIPSYTAFDSEWKKLEDGASATETFALSAMESLKGEPGSSPCRWPRLTDCIYSGVRLDHRDTQHGAARRIAGAVVGDGAYITALGIGGRWGGQGARPKSDDLRAGAGRHTGDRCPGRERVCVQLGDRRGQRLEMTSVIINNCLSRRLPSASFTSSASGSARIPLMGCLVTCERYDPAVRVGHRP
ncbi:hypothetical protein FIBSPDRAFT_388479 [Athelia psychrophila]|uniref:Coatomer gamma subunit appendage Ig-like subdomain domain-containing protein n=1 Tax=Athelia psychrophila TaxID=1759441 RepID=A0A166NTB0_9AGAM|nr:hypothetical protein FIBSPDRAFT_388479 [Fibularhizoctonia sp. CBS 109695]